MKKLAVRLYEFVLKRKISVISSLLLLCLACFALFMYWVQVQVYPELIMASDVQKLAHVFNCIHEQCKIVDFEHQKNYVDFLNVQNFIGSEVGSMNITYPDKWKGPYFHDNPTMQEKLYEVVQTKNGYFIIPGTGVQLKSGKVLGEDIIITSNTDITILTRVGGELNFNGKLLAAHVPTGNDEAVLLGDGSRILCSFDIETLHEFSFFLS